MSDERPDRTTEDRDPPPLRRGRRRPRAEEDASAGFQVGDLVLGLYEVREIHSGGGMGLVYRVRHRVWEIDLAMKSPRESFFRTEKQRQSFIQECENWIHLGLHPHTVTCYYVRVIGGVPHVFAEYVQGGALSEWIRSGRLYETPAASLGRVLDVAIQCAWGLDHAHTQGLIHQDVKPGNVMLSSGGVAKVTDFGLAKARSAGQHGAGPARAAGSGVSVAGYTPAYCSPEQAARKLLTPQTDVWSWALSVLELFTGGVSWMVGQAGPEALKAYVEDGPPGPELPRMPARLAGLLADCFRIEPGARPGDFAEIAASLVDVYGEATGQPYHREPPRPAEHLADGLNNTAVSFIDLGRNQEARGLFKKALRADPTHAEATYNRGLMYWRAGRITDETLLKQMEEVRRANPGDWRASHLLGLVQTERGDAESAVSALEDSLRVGGPPEALRRPLAHARKGIGSWCRIVRTFEGHGDRILGVDASSDGRHAVTISEELLRVWDLRSGRLLRVCEGHSDEIRSCRVSSDGRWVVTGGADRTVRLWHVATGRCRRMLTGHRDAVIAATVSRDSRWALSGSADGELRLWSLVKGTCERITHAHADGIQSVCISPDGHTAASGSWDRTIRLWDLRTGRCRATLRGHEDWVEAVEFDLSGDRLLSAGHDEKICLWDVETGARTLTLRGHSGAVTDLGVNRAGRALVSVSRDGTLRLWDLRQGRCLRTIRGHEGGVNSIALVPGTRWAFTGGDDGAARLWDLAGAGRTPGGHAVATPVSGARVFELERGVRGAVRAARRELDSGRPEVALKVLAEARAVPGFERSEELRVMWNEVGRWGRRIGLRGGWCVETVVAHDGPVCGVAVSPAESRIASCGEDGTVRILDAATGHPVEVLRGHAAEVSGVAYDPSGAFLATSSVDKSVRLWDPGKGKAAWTTRGYADWMNAVAVGPDGRYVLSGGHDGKIHVLDFATGQLVRRLDGHPAPVETVAFGVASDLILSGGQDGSVRVWLTESGECVRQFDGHRDWVSAVIQSPDGRWVVSGGWDGTIRVRDLHSGEEVHSVSAHSEGVGALAMSRQGRWLFSGGGDALLRVWDLVTGRCVRTFEGHVGSVRSLSLSADGLLLCSGGEDHTVRIWHLDWDYEIAKLDDPDESARAILKSLLVRSGHVGPDSLPFPADDPAAIEGLAAGMERAGCAWLSRETLLEEARVLVASHSALPPATPGVSGPDG